jgi:hypothetical protein
MISQMHNLLNSAQSIHQCKSVIQTSYDIVKAYGGELKVETNEGEGARFIIQIANSL